EALAERVVDGVGDGRHDRDQRHFADALHALRVLWIWHFDHDGVDHRQVRTHWHAIVEEAGVIDLALLVVDVFLVQRPADALADAALELALDIARMNGAADVLDCGVADHSDDAQVDVDLHIGDVRTEAAFGAHGVELHTGADRSTHRWSFLRKLLQ